MTEKERKLEDIIYTAICEMESDFDNPQFDILYDLIKDGLVEKVEG